MSPIIQQIDDNQKKKLASYFMDICKQDLTDGPYGNKMQNNRH